MHIRPADFSARRAAASVRVELADLSVAALVSPADLSRFEAAPVSLTDVGQSGVEDA
ncbi:MAG: hypothetical protein KIT72_14610 [Polyangiaceae bacterium]|nr:hypothetical protein [Polyangiaceae bacterium]MCW5791646.1 hypothetical protein [Polyangiaceae bacterium]